MARSSSRSVTFQRPFKLAGMDEAHPPGTFELRVEEEPLDLMWDAYHTTMTLMLSARGSMSAWPISAADLEAALTADRQFTADTGHS
jgi:hypothetical protein